MRLRHYKYELKTKLVRVVRGTRFKPREIINKYKVMGPDITKSIWIKSRDVAISVLRHKGDEFDSVKYNITFNPEEGTLLVDELPWPDPKVSYRVLTSAEDNDIYYSVEEMYNGQKKWKRIIHTPDHSTAIHKMMVIAEHNVLDEDNVNGLLVAGNYEIIVIGKDGYSYNGRDVSEITGAYVVLR
jgi:hypothetical protein